MSTFMFLLWQVEYCPCVILNDCWNMMKELLQSMVGNSAETPPPVLKHKPDTEYSPSDTILQYLEHFNNFRKTVPAPPPSRWSNLLKRSGFKGVFKSEILQTPEFKIKYRYLHGLCLCQRSYRRCEKNVTSLKNASCSAVHVFCIVV